MARMRRLPVSLAVCAGVLLLINGAIAETIETSPSLLDKLHSVDQFSEPRANNTPVGKVSSAEESVATVSPLADDHKSNDALSVEELENLERKEINVAEKKEPKAVSDESEPQGLKPGVYPEESLTPGPASNATKAEETSQDSLGKSPSTRGNAEDTSRLTRTNDIASVTGRPPPEESSGSQDDKLEKNKHQEAKDKSATVAQVARTKLNSQNETQEGGEMGTNTERSLPLKLESASSVSVASGSSASSPGVENLKEEEVEMITRGDSLPTNAREAKEASTLESKNSEVQDLEKVEAKAEPTTISLINDTNVNYAPRTNSSTASDGPTGPPENSTNSVYGDSGVSHGRVGPKEEVEVMRNVTQSPVQKIIASGRTSEQAEATAGRNESESNPPGSGAITVAEANKESLDGRTEEVKSEQGITGKLEDDQSKAADIGSNRGNREDEQTISTAEGNQAPIPRGRTIAFSLVNDFPSLESKSTSASKEIDLPSTKKVTSTEKGFEQKPYPYLKSTVSQSALKLSNHNDEGSRPENSTTEESSPLENTIVRGDSEKKIIVTEPSVVLENSIQQFKPDHSEKSENDSSNNSTSSQALSSPTTQLLPETGPTNGTLIDVGGPSESRIIAASAEEKSTSASGNDIPQGGEVITTKDGGFDVTGNGITEVTVKPETPNKDSSRPFHTTNETTRIPLISSPSPPATRAKIAPNAEMQTDVEESLLIRSTLNASETSTEFPLTRGRPESQRMTITTSFVNHTTPDPGDTTMVPVTNANSSEHPTNTEKSIGESVDSRDSNGTNEIPTGIETVTVMNKETSTTTGVEYKFVGLTEATTLLAESTTEGILRENATEVLVTGFLRTTVPVIQEISTKEYTLEDAPSTIAPDVTENLAGSEIESTATYDTTTAATMEESLVASTMPPSTMDSKLEDSTALPSYENQTEKAATSKDEQEFKVTTLTESLATTTETFATVMDTVGPPDSSETRATINVTERSSSMPGTTWILDATTVITAEDIETSRATFASPTLPPRVFGPSTSGDVTTHETTEVVQDLSPEEITSLVQIVIQGSWHEVCPQLAALRRDLADLLTSGTNNPVRAEQIVIHQNPCRETPPSTPTPTDTPLMSILVYVVDEDGKFDSTMTNMLPSLYNSTTMNFTVTIHSFLLVQEKDSGNAIAVVVVSSVAFICLVLLAGLLFIMRKRQTRFNYGERCRPVSLDAFSLDSVSAYNSVRRKGAVRASKRSYGNPTFEDSSAIPSHPLNFASLSTFCSDVNAINEEFTGIPQVSAKIDELPAGAEVKNRYANVIPLPETRVPLQKINNDPLSEYINASYMRGPRNATRYYIGCQAPMETTVTDFWRMIWEQQSKVIIMLTDLVENDVEKCTEYIPPSEVTDCHRLYGDYQVTLKKRETKEKYAISTLQLKNLENNTFREVYHIWYLWPVNGVQSDGAGLIAVILEARALQRAGPGPIVVHCSPGTGRTGTLIALDLGIRQYEITRTVDVPRVVYTIRRDRAGAVQTKEQYAFIYKALNLYATKLAGGGGLESA